RPSNAMLGMVCMTPAIPRTMDDQFLFRLTKMPAGTPTSTANNIDASVRPICWTVCSSNFSQCCETNVNKSLLSFIFFCDVGTGYTHPEGCPTLFVSIPRYAHV